MEKKFEKLDVMLNKARQAGKIYHYSFHPNITCEAFDYFLRIETPTYDMPKIRELVAYIADKFLTHVDAECMIQNGHNMQYMRDEIQLTFRFRI